MAIDTLAPRSRRSLLTGVAGALAGAAAATLAGAQRVLAAGDDGTAIHVADIYDDVRNTTRLVNNTNNQPAFRAGNNQAGNGLEGFSGSGSGVLGDSDSGAGVYGFTGTGTGVHGVAAASSGVQYAVLGEAHSPRGVGVLGNNYATSGTAEGVQGTSDSPAGYGTTGWARQGGTGIIGVSGHSSTGFPTVPAETGGYFRAGRGRGVVADGAKAQIRLVPSTASSHPTRGALGDLFLDKHKRLWFCKGGSSWTQLA
jgi:hypothetical protein